MVHGNVNVSSIFTNDAGEWKLGGFEVLSSMKEENPIILVRADPRGITLISYFTISHSVGTLQKHISI